MFKDFKATIKSPSDMLSGKEATDALNEGLKLGYENGIYQRGFEAAACDPKAWYVLDKNGEKVHLGDSIVHYGETSVVHYIGNDSIFSNGSMIFHVSEDVEKITPDTREKIIKELADWGYNSDCEESRKIAEKFVARVEALKCDA